MYSQAVDDQYEPTTRYVSVVKCEGNWEPHVSSKFRAPPREKKIHRRDILVTDDLPSVQHLPRLMS